MFHTFIQKLLNLGILTLIMAGPSLAHADEVRVAVAANFANCLKELAPLFEETTGHQVAIIVGSTGRHHAQITAGAPFDVFLAADQHHPQLLVGNGLAVASSAFTYGQGLLVLWLAETTGADTHDLSSLLADHKLSRIAMANPRLAPYGEAARQTLENLGLPADLNGRIILGTSVGQTWQFAATGNTDAAFVALSQVIQVPKGQVLTVPTDLYEPVLQQAVLLSHAQNKTAALVFLEFLAGESAAKVIRSHGYLTMKQED